MSCCCCAGPEVQGYTLMGGEEIYDLVPECCGAEMVPTQDDGYVCGSCRVEVGLEGEGLVGDIWQPA